MDKSRLEFLLNGVDTEYLPSEDNTVQYLKRKCSEEEYTIVVLPRSGIGFEKKLKDMVFSCKLNSEDVVIHGETGTQFNHLDYFNYATAVFLTNRYLISIEESTVFRRRLYYAQLHMVSTYF